MNASVAGARLERVIATRRAALESLVETDAERIAHACHEMARRFARGGTLVTFGVEAAATDAAHATVEFMHPVIVGKRALPAIAPTNEPTRIADPARLVGGDDIALGIAHGPLQPQVEDFLAKSQARGALTIAMLGAQRAPSPGRSPADYAFAVASDEPQIIQEVQETVYHVLWELVHVFFDHPGLLEDACITCGDVAVEATVVAVHGSNAVIERDGVSEEVAAELVEGVTVGDRVLCHAGVAIERLAGASDLTEAGAAPPSPVGAGDDPSGFLYPFLGGPQRDLESVLSDVRASTLQKSGDVIELRERIDLASIELCAAAVRERLTRGGRLIAFGNGGSATDAQDLVADAAQRGWPAIALNNDSATLTAVANDVGFELVYARQLIALAGARDVAFAVTTSGDSANVLAGLEEAHRRGMLTCALAGYDGGRLGDIEWLDHLLIVASDYIPRIQEAQATMYHLICDLLGEAA